MDTTTDWRPLFVASAASMLRVKASKKWPGWQDAIQEDAAKAACRQAAADIESIPALRARAEAAEQRAEALAAALAQARAEGEAAGYRRAIDEACALLDEEQLRAWATSVSPRLDGFADGVRHAMFEVRALAPVEPVSSADGLLGTAP